MLKRTEQTTEYTDPFYIKDKGEEPRTFPDLWLGLCGGGGEGMVVPFTETGKKKKKKKKICAVEGSIRIQEFRCGHAEFEMPVTHQNGGVT